MHGNIVALRRQSIPQDGASVPLDPRANPRTPLTSVLQSFSSYSRQVAVTTTRPTRFIKSGGCAGSKTEQCRQSSQQERLHFFSLRRESDRTSSARV